MNLIRRKRWKTAFTRERPTKWHPRSVSNPTSGIETEFTDTTAWSFIASRLAAGDAAEVVDLQKPPGKKAVVMNIDLGSGLPKLYVKLELSGAFVYGRSFHYSDHQ